jgi:ParB family chromosome partitioning protein
MNKAAPKKTMDIPKGLGLENIGDLAGLLGEQKIDVVPENFETHGGWMAIPLSVIEEDPNQPRQLNSPDFSVESISALAETIRSRGVKTPISVKRHPTAEGRYVINHGARRYRASLLAGKEYIPAFVDDDHNEDDQVIENIHRAGLSAREVADYIGRELAKGRKKGEIAKAIGVSPAYITQHVTLLDLPEPIAEAHNNGRVKDVTVINELVTAYKGNPSEVDEWLKNDAQELTRGSVKLLREYLATEGGTDDNPPVVDTFNVNSAQPDVNTDGNSTSGATSPSNTNNEPESPAPGKKTAEIADPSKLKKAFVLVEHDGRSARLMLDRRPTAIGWAWLKYEDDGHVFEETLSNVKLVEILEG